MTRDRAEVVATEIINFYEHNAGDEYAGEKLTQLEHMVQAAWLAEAQGFDDEVILAAFLHDIGHICIQPDESNTMGEFGTKDHEEIGADFLKQRGFSKKLVRLVESHVEAKRYLTLRESGYYEQLSEASRATLEYQGGSMSDDEADAFEQYPLFDLIISMRKWDEQAKVENLPVTDLRPYHDLIVSHLISLAG